MVEHTRELMRLPDGRCGFPVNSGTLIHGTTTRLAQVKARVNWVTVELVEHATDERGALIEADPDGGRRKRRYVDSRTGGRVLIDAIRF